MKKFLGLIFIIILSTNTAFSKVEEMKYCAIPTTEKTGNNFSKTMSNITGLNFTSTKMAELAIQKAIKTQLGSKTNVEIYPYTIGSLIQGKFKKLTLYSKLINLSGFYITKFNANTVCTYNHVGVSDNGHPNPCATGPSAA